MLRTPTGIIIMLLIVAVSLFLLYFEKTDDVSDMISISEQEQRPDFFMDEVSSVKLNPDGSIHYRLTATTLTHFSQNDLTELTNPHLTLYQNDELPWELTAQKGTLISDGSVINLRDDVELVQKEELSTSATQLLTSELTIKPNEHFATTDKPVTIKTVDGLTQAKGLNAFFKTNRIELLSEVSGVYYPK